MRAARHVIAQLKPRYWFIENPDGHLATRPLMQDIAHLLGVGPKVGPCPGPGPVSANQMLPRGCVCHAITLSRSIPPAFPRSYLGPVPRWVGVGPKVGPRPGPGPCHPGSEPMSGQNTQAVSCSHVGAVASSSAARRAPCMRSARCPLGRRRFPDEVR